MSVEVIDEVSTLLREVAATIVMPSFRALNLADIEEKSPGDIVTIVDREAETAITPRLLALNPESRVVGEEAAAAHPSLLSDLDEGLVWLVDPIDGTANYAAGREPFALMIALLSRGETIAAWMLDPISDVLAVAERGSGAWLAGKRMATSPGSPGPSALRGAVFTQFMPVKVSAAVEARLPAIGERVPGYMCCGAEYPAIAVGKEDFALFWRTWPWDHAPGSLFLCEAGGHVARPNGNEYRPAVGSGGLLAASSRDIWIDAHDSLLRQQ